MNPIRLSKRANRDGPIYLHSRQDFSQFYDYYAPMLYGHLLRRGQDAALAESILVDVFFTSWQERVAFNENQSRATQQDPLSWLLSIAHRKEQDQQV